jgi:transposase
MMMCERQVDQGALFYEFSLEKHVPADHMLRAIDRFADLGEVRPYLAQFYGTTGRPSVDPELLIRMLIIGYCYGIRSERRLCEEVHLNLATGGSVGSRSAAPEDRASLYAQPPCRDGRCARIPHRHRIAGGL